MKTSGCQGLDSQIQFLKEEIVRRTRCSGTFENDINKKINDFKSKFKVRWEKVSRVEPRFLKNNRVWLDTPIVFKYNCPFKGKRGRPSVSFEEGSERTKRQKTAELRRSTSLSQLTFATEMSLRASGQSETAKVIHEVTRSPSKVETCRKALEFLLNLLP